MLAGYAGDGVTGWLLRVRLEGRSVSDRYRHHGDYATLSAKDYKSSVVKFFYQGDSTAARGRKPTPINCLMVLGGVRKLVVYARKHVQHDRVLSFKPSVWGEIDGGKTVKQLLWRSGKYCGSLKRIIFRPLARCHYHLLDH